MGDFDEVEDSEDSVTDFNPTDTIPTTDTEYDYVAIENETKRKPGRPKGSKNFNAEYKRKEKERESAKKALWGRGELHWKLDSNQKVLYKAFKKRNSTTLIWMTSRQIGKTWTACTISLEECMQNPNFRIAYVCPKQNQSKKIVKAKILELLQDCPVELRPKFKTQDNIWEFPNGSEIHCCGSDGGNIETLRGNKFNIIFIDEFAFLDDFDYALNSVLFPTMTTIENPVMVMISSPPKSHSHPSNEWIDRAEGNGTLITKTIYDCPRFSNEKIQGIINKQFHGDKNNIHFRREYMCERIPDITSLVLPEASATKMKELIFDEYKSPDYKIPTVSADWGVQDNNGILFGYYDFINAKIVIEDELLLDGVHNTTENIKDSIFEKEDEIWEEGVKPKRYCDNNLQLINDLSLTYGLDFMATHKDNLHAAVNEVRMRIMKDELLISSKCTNLIAQMKSALWDKRRKQFKRSGQDHSDMVAALIYLVRNIDTFNNPFPADYQIPKHYFKSPKREWKNESSFEKSIKNIFTIKRKSRNKSKIQSS